LIGERPRYSLDNGGDQHNADRSGEDEPADDAGDMKGESAIH
jgi:hypothetical protein